MSRTRRTGTYWDASDPRFTKVGLAAWIPELTANWIAQSWAISLLYGSAPDTDLFDVAAGLQPEVALPRSDGSDVVVPIAPFVRIVTDASQKSEAYTPSSALVTQASIVLAQLGDAFMWSGVQDAHGSDPLLQFLRHVRNGLSHGSYFSFKRPEELTRRPAKLRDLQLTAEHEGKAVFSVLGLGDVLDLLEDLHRFLAGLSKDEEQSRSVHL